MVKTRALGLDRSEKLYGAFCHLFILIFTILCVYPFYYIIIYSISDPSMAKTGVYLWPKGLSFETYKQLLSRDDFGQALLVSASRTVIGTTITILCTSVYAFLMTRKEMIGRKLVYRFTVITMYLSAGLIPWYLIMKAYHLNNSFLLYVLPGAINAYYLILIKTYIEQIPEALEEAAVLEGAGFFQILFRVILPISKPILATCIVYCSVAQWNSWQDNFFLVRDANLQTLQLILRNYLSSADKVAQSIKSGGAVVDQASSMITPQSIQMVAIVVVTIPIMLVYPFAQKYFTKGIMMGAVKG